MTNWFPHLFSKKPRRSDSLVMILSDLQKQVDDLQNHNAMLRRTIKFLKLENDKLKAQLKQGEKR